MPERGEDRSQSAFCLEERPAGQEEGGGEGGAGEGAASGEPAEVGTPAPPPPPCTYGSWFPKGTRTITINLYK